MAGEANAAVSNRKYHPRQLHRNHLVKYSSSGRLEKLDYTGHTKVLVNPPL